MEVLYKHSYVSQNTKAAEVIVPMLRQFVGPFASVLDVGCGIGTWLKVIMEKYQVTDCIGLDGGYTDRKMLLIPQENFRECDLRQSFDLGRSFDLLICTEVAEHIPEVSVEAFLDSLCAHASTIIFSAAIPGQGGQNHVNEQWPGYWKNKFWDRGFTRLDVIRPYIWKNPMVDVWYKQNLFVFTSRGDLVADSTDPSIHAEIHPDLWSHKIAALEDSMKEINSFEKGGAGISRSWKALVNAIINKVSWHQR